MPTYTYRCTKCGEEVEAFQSMSDPPLRRCKKCRGALRRTFHPVGIVLKGSGFHKTDYRSKSSSAERKKDSDGEKKEASTTETSKSETSKSETSKTESSSKDSSKTGSKSSGSDS